METLQSFGLLTILFASFMLAIYAAIFAFAAFVAFAQALIKLSPIPWVIVLAPFAFNSNVRDAVWENILVFSAVLAVAVFIRVGIITNKKLHRAFR